MYVVAYIWDSLSYGSKLQSFLLKVQEYRRYFQIFNTHFHLLIKFYDFRKESLRIFPFLPSTLRVKLICREFFQPYEFSSLKLKLCLKLNRCTNLHFFLPKLRIYRLHTIDFYFTVYLLKSEDS